MRKSSKLSIKNIGMYKYTNELYDSEKSTHFALFKLEVLLDLRETLVELL